MTHWQLTLFGAPQLEQAGQPVAIGRRKGLALLAYLALTNGAHHRDALATLLWPDTPQQRARRNLRQVLSDLNKALDKTWLLIDAEQVSLIQNDNLRLDVARFQSCLALSQAHDHPPEDVCPACLPLLQEAADLYRADFLEGFTLRDAPEFDDWQFFQAESLRQDLAVVLERLVQGYANQKDYEAALPHARRWLNLDPLHEPAHRMLMRLYAAADQQSAALRQYEECVRLLDEEFGLPPEMETTTLYEAIKAKRMVMPFLKAEARRGREAEEMEGAGHHAPQASNGARQSPTSPPLPDFLPDFLKEAPPVDPPPVFVARERELAELEAALDSARTGQGQILFVIGGAGRGKSMLIQEFSRRAQAGDADLAAVHGYCDAMTGVGDPYLPFREALTLLTGDVEAKWAGGVISQAQARRLWELMPLTLPALVEHAPDLIGNFVPAEALKDRAATLNAPGAVWFKQLTTLAAAEPNDGLEQQRLFSQYTALLKAIAAQRPLLLIIEDLHWIDTASSGLIFHLSREIAGSPILILGTYRPEEIPSNWSDDQHPLGNVVSELKRQHGDIWLDLDDLAGIEGRQFIDAYLDMQPNRLDAEFREALFRQTGGYALFTVELLRDMQERGDLVQADDGRWQAAETIDWQTLPVKVEGVIETRLKRLEKVWQEVLAVASVEGETFTAEVAARVQGIDERALVQQLSRELDKGHRLITAQSLDRVGRQRLSRYRFRHNLFQHYLYYSLDELDRSYLHEAVGHVLEELYAGQTQQVAVQLAWHFQEAGLVDKAILYLQQAGAAAAQVYAHTEAIAAYRQALALIKQRQLDDIDNQVLTQLYSRLGRTLELNAQFDEALLTYEEMGQHARQRGEPVLELAALLAQITLYCIPCPVHDPGKGETLVEQALPLARDLGDQAAETKLLWNLLHAYEFSNRIAAAIEVGEQAIALARELNLREQLAYTLNDIGTCYFLIGHFEQAEAVYREAKAMWQELDNLPMLADCLGSHCSVAVYAGAYEQAKSLSDEAFQISQATGNLWGQIYSLFRMGYVYLEQGQMGRALTVMAKSLRLSPLAGYVPAEIHIKADQAVLYGSLGDVDRGLELAKHCLRQAEAVYASMRSRILSVLAHLHFLQDNLGEAAAAINEAKNDPYCQAWPVYYVQVRLAEGELIFRQRDYEPALTILDRAITDLRQFKMRSQLPYAFYLRGQVLLGLNQTEAARAALQEARGEAEAINARRMLWQILALLAMLEPDPNLAQRLRRQARDIVDSIANSIAADDLQASFLNLPQVQALF